jgi:hypothetical protein
VRRFVPVLVVIASGCGASASDYEREASAQCTSFNDAAFAGHVEVERARVLYARLGDGLDRLSPPDDLRRTHDVLLGFARGGERIFADVRDAHAPTVDLRLTVGDWDEDVAHVKRRLPDCADTLTGTHPEIQVIR